MRRKNRGFKGLRVKGSQTIAHWKNPFCHCGLSAIFQEKKDSQQKGNDRKSESHALAIIISISLCLRSAVVFADHL